MTCCCGISAVKKPVFCWMWANSSCGCGAPLCFTCRPGALPETIRFPSLCSALSRGVQTQDEEKLSEEEGHNRQLLSCCLISNHRAHSLHFPLYYSLSLSLFLSVCVCHRCSNCPVCSIRAWFFGWINLIPAVCLQRTHTGGWNYEGIIEVIWG